MFSIVGYLMLHLRVLLKNTGLLSKYKKNLFRPEILEPKMATDVTFLVDVCFVCWS